MLNFFFTNKKTFHINKTQEEFLLDLEARIAFDPQVHKLQVRKEYVDYYFEGNISNYTFSITRVLKRGANSFIPIVKGAIKEDKEGNTELVIHSSFQRIPKIIFIVFNLYILCLIVIVIITGNLFTWISGGYLSIFIISWISSYLIYKHELGKVYLFLEELL